MNEKIHVVHVGLSGFPYANKASINKQLAIAKGLQYAGVDIKILNKKGVYNRKNVPNASREGVYQGIPYYTAYDTPYKPNSFYKRNLLKIKGMLYEIGFLAGLKSNKQLDVAILDAHLFRNILFYRILSKLIGFKLIYHYVEMRSQMHSKDKKMMQRIGHKLIDDNVARVFDGIFAISTLLMETVKSKNPHIPVLKLPVMTDYDQFNIPKDDSYSKYFLYCGNAAYKEVILFILDVTHEMLIEKNICLYLVISGNNSKKAEIKDEIARRNLSHKIKIFSNLPYEELVRLYVNAMGLLIPLRPTIQDNARFPHKISEYLASGNPLITTAYGEILNYFEDGENALVASAYDEELYRNKMMYVLENPEQAIEMGRKGYETGYANFHYAQQGVNIKNFIEKAVLSKN